MTLKLWENKLVVLKVKEGRGSNNITTSFQDQIFHRLLLRNKAAASSDLKLVWESVIGRQVTTRSIPESTF